MRYATLGKYTYHLLPGRADGRTLCGMVVVPEEGDREFDERPADRRLCQRCERLEDQRWAK